MSLNQAKYTIEDEETYILAKMLHFADHHPHINLKFVEEVNSFLENNGYITDKQIDILTELFFKHKVHNFLLKWDGADDDFFE
jgi:hypothetical protein